MPTREEWLEQAVEKFKEGVFQRSGYTLPKVKVSVGFPYASRGGKSIGQCWPPEASDNGLYSVFISPTINEREALGTLAHELVHVAVGVKEKHNKVFGKCARSIGLKGPMRSTTTTPEMDQEVGGIVSSLGNYPHGVLNPEQSGRKKQGTRLYKMWCEECGYTARSTRKYLLIQGPLICPCNHSTMELDPTLDKEDLLLLFDEPQLP